MGRELRLCFVDFWPGFNPSDNFFYHLLCRHLAVERLTFDFYEPDLLFFSCFGGRHLAYREASCRRVLFLGENVRPNLESCDLALTFDRIDDARSVRLPLWKLYVDWFDQGPVRGEPSYLVPPRDLVKGPSFAAECVTESRDFCGFVYSRDAKERSAFFRRLNGYKPVKSAGPLFNNVGSVLGGNQEDKIAWLRGFKFTICYENSSHPGYVTEKILHAMAAGTIPIYWGDPDVGLDFNPASFLNRHDFDSDDALIEEIVRLDNDDAAYRAMLQEPWFEAREPRLPEDDLVSAILPTQEATRSPGTSRAHRETRSGILPGIDRAYVINLERRPERLANFRARCPLPADHVERWPAVDGRDLEPTRELRTLFAGNDFKSRRNVMGCALSHYRLWQDAARLSDPEHCVLVLEDDAYLPEHFAETWSAAVQPLVPGDFDLLYLGGFPLPGTVREMTSEKLERYELEPRDYVEATVNTHLAIPRSDVWCPCTWSYVITSAGARKLCRAVENGGIRRAIDHFLRDHWPELQVYITVPLLGLGFVGGDTDIQRDAARLF